MAEEGVRLEDWIGDMVTAEIVREPFTDPADAILTITGLLRGVDPSGVILLFYPTDVPEGLGSDLSPHEAYATRYAFYPWRRVASIGRPEEPQEPQEPEE